MGLTTKKNLPFSAIRFETRYMMFIVADLFEQFEELLLETDDVTLLWALPAAFSKNAMI